MSKVEDLREAIADGGVDRLLASWRPDVRGIAVAAARRVGAASQDEIEDIESLAWEVVATMVEKERDGTAPDHYEFDAFLVMTLRNRVRQWLDRERAPASRMSSVLRRRRAILSLMSRGLSAREAVALLNESGRRGDGTYRQSDLSAALSSEPIDEVGEHRLRPFLPDDEVSELMAGPTARPAAAPFDGRAFVEDVTEQVGLVSPAAAEVVYEWLWAVLEGEAVTVPELARRTGKPRSAVEGAVEVGRAVAAVRLRQLRAGPDREW